MKLPINAPSALLLQSGGGPQLELDQPYHGYQATNLGRAEYASNLPIFTTHLALPESTATPKLSHPHPDSGRTGRVLPMLRGALPVNATIPSADY